MKNRVSVGINLVLALIFVFYSQISYAQPAVETPSVQEQTQELSEHQKLELQFKKDQLLNLIQSLEDPEMLKKVYDFFVVHDEILTHYVDEKSFNHVLNLGMTGMVEGLDPYSHLFIDQAAEEIYKDFTEEENYAGVGMAIMSFHKNIFVSEVFDNTPAAKAGIQPGDQLLKVIDNGISKDVYGLSTNEVVELVKGKEGTPVTVEIRSPRSQKPETMTLIRQQVVIESVSYKQLKRDIAYIKIRSFTPDKEVSERFRDVLNKSAGKKLIIDLRDNGGGSLNAVNRMVGFLTGPGKVLISVKGREGEQFWATPKVEDPPNLPSKIVVLVNNYSASASEIMAGNLKHYKLATLVGVRTYGKATVQNYLGLDMPDHQIEGSHLIMGITIERYYLPDGTNITGNGVEPDVEVEQPENFKNFDYLTKKDAQFQKALKILK